MGIDIRLPQITGSEKEQLSQIRSYLFQLASQLQWALSNSDTSNNSVVVKETPKSLYQSSEGNPKGAQATFDSIKALIIKSADIVEAYYQEINDRLVGTYVAQSDFGTFSEQTVQDIETTSTGVTRAFTNIQEIETNLQDTRVGIGSNLESLSEEVGQIDTELQGVKAGVDTNFQELTGEVGSLDTRLEEAKTNLASEIQAVKADLEALNFAVVEVTANIKSGLLYNDENGIPVYGLEIGQKNVIDGVEVFNKFARFTAGRLTFYDQNGSEVAYISDYKLYITHVEVTGTMKLGGYLVDTRNGLTFKWVGR